MEPEVKAAKATLLSYLLKEKEEMARDKQRFHIREKDFNNLLKELADGLKMHESMPVVEDDLSDK